MAVQKLVSTVCNDIFLRDECKQKILRLSEVFVAFEDVKFRTLQAQSLEELENCFDELENVVASQNDLCLLLKKHVAAKRLNRSKVMWL